MRLGDRFRRRARAFRTRLTVELVRLPERPAPPPPAAALPAPERPRRPRRGGGLSPYTQVIAPDPAAAGRPRPLGRGPAHDKAIYRDQVSAWRTGGPAPPPPSLDLAELRAELHTPRIPWWEQRSQQE